MVSGTATASGLVMFRILLVFLAVALPLPAMAQKKVETQKITAPAEVQPEINHGTEGLPAKVAATRRQILEAAYSGDMTQLKKVMQHNEVLPAVSINDVGDPIDYLKAQSGDGEGLEILAILTDILESGWARVDAGKPTEQYVWPYFATLPMDKLTPEQKVEAFKIITSSDYDAMRADGKYRFYSVGIGPDGTWHSFKIED
jgi:hypothetical protein